MRVLVVDDDAFVRVLLCLDLPEVDLVEATRVQEALEAFVRREPLDAIIVDLRLADGSGLDVVRHARSREWTRNLPIVVLTADGSADAAEIYTAGADVYIVKPFVAADVLAAIASVQELQPTERRKRRRRLSKGVEVGELRAVLLLAEPEPGTLRRFWRKAPTA